MTVPFGIYGKRFACVPLTLIRKLDTAWLKPTAAWASPRPPPARPSKQSACKKRIPARMKTTWTSRHWVPAQERLLSRLSGLHSERVGNRPETIGSGNNGIRFPAEDEQIVKREPPCP